nr:MAG TPA: hypothetical protein [Caudoviricetes sp.]
MVIKKEADSFCRRYIYESPFPPLDSAFIIYYFMRKKSELKKAF